MDISPQTSLLFKAVVVIAVCLIQAPAFRARLPAVGADVPATPPGAGRRAEKEQVPA